MDNDGKNGTLRLPRECDGRWRPLEDDYNRLLGSRQRKIRSAAANVAPRIKVRAVLYPRLRASKRSSSLRRSSHCITPDVSD
jgi:hypothetical protein